MRTTTRRALLAATTALAGGGLLAACSSDSDPRSGSPASSPGGHGGDAAPGDYVTPNDPAVAAAERRRRPGPAREVRLTAARARLDLGGGVQVSSWAYDGHLPGREVRISAGETLALTLANHLPQTTSTHWHGLALRNDMDGVPGLTQRAVRAGGSFAYRFAVPHPGTYWFHPHSGVQQDRGLYAPLIVEDPREPLSYDREWVVVLDDWVDGVQGSTPDAVLAELSSGMGHDAPGGDGTSAPTDHSGTDHGGTDHGGMDHGDMGGEASPSPGGGMDHGAHGAFATNPGPGAASSGPARSGPPRMMMGATSRLLGGDAGDVAYPYYLANGRTAKDPRTFTARPGDRVRIRLINAGGDTAFRVALGGHRMTVTHTDGFPVEHARTDALLLGMGERYDVLVTVGDGVFPLTAVAEGKRATALTVLRTGRGAAPAAGARPRELEGRLLTASDLRAAESVRLSPRAPDRTLRLRLTGSMARYDWAINGRRYDPGHREPVRAGERVRLSFVNDTTMWHPMHLHGHTFALATRAGAGRRAAPGTGARKDTVIVLPGRRVEVDFDADNPGLWMLHCHNVYHAESGMMSVLGYRR
ncbi:multicopper oxidase family protein [Streptomyces sp. NPDC057702]|uniref:multicopper oxidase family protein n=1 Tax=unclassified Streptomyces TaxID=2593676 RepID=UPI0036B6E5C2